MILCYVKTKTAGLANLGNTCFMNTCLQILAHTFELNDLCIKSRVGKMDKDDIWVQWRELLIEMWKRRPQGGVVVQPHKFVFFLHKTAQKLGVPLFSGWAQNDFAEFLHFLVSRFHASTCTSVDMMIRGDVSNEVDKMALECYTMMKREYAKEYSEVMALFQGVCVSEILSVDGSQTYSTKAEMFVTLDLPLYVEKNGKGLDALLTAFTSTETLEGDNAWFNEATGEKETVLKRCRLWSVPPVLVVALKRFDGNGKKNAAYMSYPVRGLDMSPYVCGYRRESLVYDLYGVACHLGGTQGGHYFALVQNAQTGQWYCYNDDRITVIGTEQEVITNQAYCLFYRRRV